MAASLSRQDYPFSNILRDYRKAGGADPERLAALGFNLDRNLNLASLDGAAWEAADFPETVGDSDLNLTVLQHDRGATVSFHHRVNVMGDEEASRWLRRYLDLLIAVCAADPNRAWWELAEAAGVKRCTAKPRAEATFAFE